MFLGKVYKAIGELDDRLWRLRNRVDNVETKAVDRAFVRKVIDEELKLFRTQILDEIRAADPSLRVKLFEGQMKAKAQPDLTLGEVAMMGCPNVVISQLDYNRLVELAFPDKKGKKAR